MWFAPLPVLLFSNRASWSAAALTAALAWLVGNLNLWHLYVGVLGIPQLVVVRILISLALMFTLAVLLYRALLQRGAYWSALLALPSFWVSFEYLLNLASPHGTFGSLAYSQLSFLPFLQLASVTGPWGLTFLLLLFPTALAIGLHLRATAARRALNVAGVSVAAVAAALVFGAVRLAVPQPGPSVRVGLIASDAPGRRQVADEGAPTAQLFSAYANEVATLAAKGAQVIVLPEKLGVAVDPGTSDSDALFQSLADKTRISIVVGMVHASGPAKYNQARMYMPQGSVLSYDKEHMLPPFESMFKPGTSLALVSQPSGIWGVEICKDMDFTQLSRRYGHAGAGLMLVPAWDFDLDRLAHGHMALMRGVESGFSVVRAARRGYLTVTDSRGRILAETASNSAPFATLLADVPTVHVNTLYLRFGDWFAWLALALLAITLVQVALNGNRAPAG
jgi:apolipoprotein N-acyltransferase